MNPLLRSNASRCKAMDNLAQVTPEKFHPNDNVIPIQDHLQQMNSSENCSVSKYYNHFIQKFLTKDRVRNALDND